MEAAFCRAQVQGRFGRFEHERLGDSAQVYHLMGCYNPWNMQIFGHRLVTAILKIQISRPRRFLGSHIREHGVLGITEHVERLCTTRASQGARRTVPGHIMRRLGNVCASAPFGFVRLAPFGFVVLLEPRVEFFARCFSFFWWSLCGYHRVLLNSDIVQPEATPRSPELLERMHTLTHIDMNSSMRWPTISSKI